jgi:hypothetical protein
MSARAVVTAAALSALALGAGLRGCARREAWPGPPGRPVVQRETPPLTDDPTIDVDRAGGAHPRILLTPERAASVARLRDGGSPAWGLLRAACDAAEREPIAAGYEGWDWANAALDLALCGAVMGRAEDSAAAVRYLRALLDDQANVGDGEGGDAVVHHDDGYPIRTRGCFGAIAYDWLHDAPGMTPELRKHAIDRFVAWDRWFGESGYAHDQPIANYYVGWFGAVAFGGIGAQGDDPRAGDLRRRARRMFAGTIAPAYGQKLAGGDFPEGWQYGDLVGAVLAIFLDAESRPKGLNAPLDALPWLSQSLAFREHALWPDGKHMLDTGDWSEKPAVAPAHTLAVLSTVMPSDGDGARRARLLARLAADPRGEEWHWLAAIAEASWGVPPAPGPDPASRSYLAEGTGTLVARSDWSPGAVWFAIASAPSLSDHQHLDAGHFEIVRGGDALLIDGGGYGAYSSLSHNVIAVDDRRENDKFAPSQGVWSDAARIARHEDEGRFVYALADYTSAYDPPGYPQDHPARSVARAEREVVFSRAPIRGLEPESARIVVYDRVTLTKPSFVATFLLHGPHSSGALDRGVRFAAGRSAAVVTTILPASVPPVFVAEPTTLGEGPYFANDPPEGTHGDRLEVRSKAGALERRFLHAIVVGGAAAHFPDPVAVEGDGADGVAIGDEAYVFRRSGPAVAGAGAADAAVRIDYRAPAEARRHVVASLAPRARYAVMARAEGDGCRVAIGPEAGAAAPSPSSSRATAGDAGVVVVELGPGCTLTPPSPGATAAGGGAP